MYQLAPDLIQPDPKDPKFAHLIKQLKRKPRKVPETNATVDPINFKLQYLEAMIEHLNINEFRDVWLNLCHIAATQLRIVWQLLRIDATSGARTLLNRNDMFARFAGNALLIWKCRPVHVSKIHWDYKYGNECFSLLPIETDDNRLKFVLPGSNDIVETSPTIPCDQVFQGIYFDP